MASRSPPLARLRRTITTLIDLISSTPSDRSGETSILLSSPLRRARGSLRRTSESAESDGEADGLMDDEEMSVDSAIGSEEGLPPPSYASNSSSSSSRHLRIDPIFCLVVVIGIGWTVGLLLAYPFPTTIPVFVGLMVVLFGWTTLSWTRLLYALIRRRESASTIFARYSAKMRIEMVLALIVLVSLTSLGVTTPPVEAPVLPAEINGVRQKYFIAANLHNNEAVLARWSDQLVKLIFHLGRENTFVSIYESNSRDNTKTLLSVLNNTLSNLSINHRIITADDDKHSWPYPTSRERIAYLATARNKALEPIQSADDSVRIGDWQEYTRLLFLNDVWYNWQSMARLLDTRIGDEEVPDYDQACAFDFSTSGLYDTWAARDTCGTPLRVFWPYVQDPVSIEKLKREEPFEVTSCWNGAAAFKAEPFLYKPDKEPGVSTPEPTIMQRGWRMVDNDTYPLSEFSPPIANPLQFRTSNISACDHSECFLIGYDLHRIHAETGPKIYMNPTVKVTYEQNWYRWHNVVLRVPMINWWLTHWSRGIPLKFVDWLWEHFGRRRDYCTWAALSWHMPDRCPPLPGAIDRSWEQ
ncbi:hypothetical protein IAU60_000658 [Kwoniella sp. DSM 27419]